LEFALRKLAIETVNAQLAVRRLERQGLTVKVESAETPSAERVAANARLAKIDHESRGLEDVLELLTDENRLP
jgi:hypothetical protein